MQNVKILQAFASHFSDFSDFVLKEVHQVLSVCVNASALDEFEFMDPGGSRCSVPSAQCHAERQISDGSWFTKAGILRHFSVNEAPVVQTSSSTHPMSSYVKVPQPHRNDIQICLNSGNFLCHSNVQGFFSLKPHKAVWRTFPKIMRVSLAPSAALQPSSKCVTSCETSICTVCIWKTKNC